DEDYAEYLAGLVPEEEQENEEEGHNPVPIELSSDDTEEKSEISAQDQSE
ncbi:hypothetical protein L195_g063568, partial [Trifolium pratense]